MVFTDVTRRELVDQAIECWRLQDWPYKEMLVINATSRPFISGGVRVINIVARHLGELKNLAVYNAHGEWCFPWPDDCIMTPDYMEWHMTRRDRSACVVVQNPYGILPDGFQENVSFQSALFCSFHRFNPHRYDEDGDEMNFIMKFPLSLAESKHAIAVRRFRHAD